MCLLAASIFALAIPSPALQSIDRNIVTDPELLWTLRGCFPYPVEPYDDAMVPVWTWDTMNYHHYQLYPAGRADERYIINASKEDPDRPVFMSLSVNAGLYPRKEWAVRLDRLPKRAPLVEMGPDPQPRVQRAEGPGLGTLEKWLLRHSLKVQEPVAPEVLAKLRVVRPYALYFGGREVVTVHFVDINGRGHYGFDEYSNTIMVSLVDGDAPISSFERRWLAGLRNAGAKREVPEYAKPIPSNVVLGGHSAPTERRYIRDPKLLWREREFFPPVNERPWPGTADIVPIWSRREYRFSNAGLFPAGAADERFLLNVDDKGQYPPTLSLVTNRGAEPVREWWIVLGRDAGAVKRLPSEMGTVELWLAKEGFFIGADLAEGIRSKLKERHPFAVYKLPGGGYNSRLAFISADGSQGIVSNEIEFEWGASLITLDERDWLKRLPAR